MNIDAMPQQLIDIYNIRNLESIKFWDLHGTSDSKLLVIPAIMITYDGGKNINLCAKDKYFDDFVRKIVEVYNDEKNNILEDSLTDPFRMRQHIRIDERTKSILESGILNQINSIYSFYNGKDSYNSSLLFQIDEVKMLLPIIMYHVKKVFAITDINVSFGDSINGYKNFYTIEGKINGIDKYFVFSFIKLDNNTYEIGIQGLLNKNIPFTMKISFKNDSLVVDSFMGDQLITATNEYLITNGVVKDICSIKKGEIPIFYENKDLEKTSNDLSNISDIDSNPTLEWFRLPWGALYGIDNKVLDVSETEKTIELHNMFIGNTGNSVMMREYFSKSYRRNRTVSVNALDVTLDEVVKNISIVCLDPIKGIYAVETSFYDRVDKSGYYEENLSGNYFYHIVSSDTGIGGISREGLVPISKEDNVLSGVDLLNKANVYRLVKGE